MQETRGPDDRLMREFFVGNTNGQIHEEMDRRLEQLQAEGHTLVKRTRIGRNATCPCGSGRKFKKCCLPGARRVSSA